MMKFLVGVLIGYRYGYNRACNDMLKAWATGFSETIRKARTIR